MLVHEVYNLTGSIGVMKNIHIKKEKYAFLTSITPQILFRFVSRYSVAIRMYSSRVTVAATIDIKGLLTHDSKRHINGYTIRIVSY